VNDSLQDLYRQRVLAHSRDPHNQRRISMPDREVTGFNPLCGDKLTVFLSLDGDKVTDAAFEGSGCAISVASASMMTDVLNGLTTGEALELVDQVEGMFATDADGVDSRLEEMTALQSVRAYPSRIKCAMLAWSSAGAALRDDAAQVSTE